MLHIYRLCPGGLAGVTGNPHTVATSPQREMEPVMYYPKRNGDYVYDVTVTTDDTATVLRRFRAHMSNAEHIDD